MFIGLLFFSFLFVSKEYIYINEEILVIVSFLLFVALFFTKVAPIIGDSFDVSIEEIKSGVLTSIKNYLATLEKASSDLLFEKKALNSAEDVQLFINLNFINLFTSTSKHVSLANVLLAQSAVADLNDNFEAAEFQSEEGWFETYADEDISDVLVEKDSYLNPILDFTSFISEEEEGSVLSAINSAALL